MVFRAEQVRAFKTIDQCTGHVQDRTTEKCISDSRFKMGHRSVKVTWKGQRHIQPEADSNWKIHIQQGFEETAGRNG
jgi:hypothetical protein